MASAASAAVFLRTRVQQDENPRNTAGFFSTVTFWWLRSLLWRGYKNGGSHGMEDVPGIREGLRAGDLREELERRWRRELALAGQAGGRRQSLALATGRMVWAEYRMLGIWPLLSECVLKVLSAFLMSWTIQGFRLRDERVWLLGAGFVAVSALSVVAHHALLYQAYVLGIKAKAALSSLIYRKTLRLSLASLARSVDVGHITTLLTNDVTQCDEVFLYLHYAWVGVVQLIVMTYVGWAYAGVGSLGGMAFILVLTGLQMLMSSTFATWRSRTAKKTDKRLKVMNDIIVNMKMIKLYAWEYSFGQLIKERRRKEMKIVRMKSVLKALNDTCLMVGTKGMQLAFLATYVLFMSPGQTMLAETVYLSLGLLSGARLTMTCYVPYMIMSFNQWLASMKRIQHFLELEEVSKHQTSFITGVAIKDLNASWDSDDKNEAILKNVTMRLSPGVLNVLTGAVGTGKTTLLHVILGEIPLSKGHLDVGGSIGYVSQEAWIFSGSVRENILFGKAMTEGLYWKVVKMCGLDRDFATWKFGDQTLVGERGLMLSGGQKARLSLARAVYQDADVYLLDDVFAAVDCAVGRHIMDQCVTGHLADRAVLITTHSPQCASRANELYELRDGGTLFKIEKREPVVDESTLAKNDFETAKGSDKKPFRPGEDNITVEMEVKHEGTVSWSTYYSFFAMSKSYFLMFVYVTLCLVSPLAYSTSDIFIATWLDFVEGVKDKEAPNPTELPDNLFYLLAFSGLVLILVVVMAAQVLCQYKVCMDSSQATHDNMFQRVVRAPMRFFSSNPVGQVMTRFSKDMFAVDELLPRTIFEVETLFFRIAITSLVIGYYMPVALLPVLALALVSLWLRKLYVMSSNPLKRLEAIAKAPLLSQVNSTVAGIVTVRAAGKESLVQGEFDLQQDVLTSAAYTYQAVARWLCVWIDCLAVTFQAMVVGNLVLADNHDIRPGDIGVLLLTLSDLTKTLQYSLRMTAHLQNVMTSAERILEYGRLLPENSLTDDDDQCLDKWPNDGGIQFKDVSLSYDEKGSAVLKGLDFKIMGREKVGIVGRTGAGKSSLIAALFRLTEPSGEICIDGIPTSKIGLHKLRRNMSIIPQDPLLICGSLRRNLDPFQEFDDEVLWRALDKVHLGNLARSSERGLQMPVLEGGSNLSCGQKQLLCLARAIVRSNRILVLDEATANIDPRTDKLIADAIRNHFRDCTVLTVAHRLHTVMDCDRIMVMSDGQILEFDSPCALLGDPRSALSGFLHRMSQEEQRHLREQAKEAEARRRTWT